MHLQDHSSASPWDRNSRKNLDAELQFPPAQLLQPRNQEDVKFTRKKPWVKIWLRFPMSQNMLVFKKKKREGGDHVQGCLQLALTKDGCTHLFQGKPPITRALSRLSYRSQLWNYYLAWIILTKSAWGIIHWKPLKFGETNKPYQTGLVSSAPCAVFHNYWKCKRNISPSNQASAVELRSSSSTWAQKSSPVLERSPERLCWSILGPSLLGFYEGQDH